MDEYGTLSTKMLVKVMEQVCSGFYYLHSLSPAIVYRDLKPANIILQTKMEELSLLILA